MEEKDNKIASVQETERKEKSRFRCFWAFIIFDIVLFVYLVYQLIKIFVGF